MRNNDRRVRSPANTRVKQRYIAPGNQKGRSYVFDVDI